MTRPLITFVVAIADNGVIGRDGGLPWRLRSDMHRFRSVTMGKPMIMGRKTFESLPRLLDGRRHIVLSRDPDWHAEGAEVVRTVDQALQAVAAAAEATVIGGAEIFRLFLPVADRVELTEVHARPEGDTLMEPFDPARWREVVRESHGARDGLPAYSFVTLARR